MHPDNARELKSRLLRLLGSAAAAQDAGEPPRRLWVAVGLTPLGRGRARVAVRLERASDRDVLPDLGRAAQGELDVRVIGPVHPLSSVASRWTASSRWSPAALQQHVRPLRPGLSVAHLTVSAGTLGGFVRTADGLAILSNNHVLAASNAASPGDAVLQPGPADRGTALDRIATLAAFDVLRPDARNLVDAAVATLDADVPAEPGDLPGGPLGPVVVPSLDIDPDEDVEKIGRTTGHTRGRISAVEVDGVAVQYDDAIHTFDDQIEIEGRAGGFSAGGDSGSVIWRSRDRSPLGLLFAGSTTGGSGGAGVTFANPLATVLERFDAVWVS
jgi:hypothetical protein